MTNKTRDWLIALGYVALIYGTLSVARTPINFLRDKGGLRIFLGILYVGSFGSLLWGLVKVRLASWWRLLVLFGIFVIFLLIAPHISSPEEQIHFLEYGLVGFLFLRALRWNYGICWKTFLFAFILASLAGWVDELIQNILPNRFYDHIDILLNVVSAFLGLSVYALFLPSPHLKPSR